LATSGLALVLRLPAPVPGTQEGKNGGLTIQDLIPKVIAMTFGMTPQLDLEPPWSFQQVLLRAGQSGMNVTAGLFLNYASKTSGPAGRWHRRVEAQGKNAPTPEAVRPPPLIRVLP
jgi:hypothetical protein